MSVLICNLGERFGLSTLLSFTNQLCENVVCFAVRSLSCSSCQILKRQDISFGVLYHEPLEADLVRMVTEFAEAG